MDRFGVFFMFLRGVWEILVLSCFGSNAELIACIMGSWAIWWMRKPRRIKGTSVFLSCAYKSTHQHPVTNVRTLLLSRFLFGKICRSKEVQVMLFVRGEGSVPVDLSPSWFKSCPCSQAPEIDLSSVRTTVHSSPVSSCSQPLSC